MEGSPEDAFAQHALDMAAKDRRFGRERRRAEARHYFYLAQLRAALRAKQKQCKHKRTIIIFDSGRNTREEATRRICRDCNAEALTGALV